MATLVATMKKWYLLEIRALDYVKHVFLLVLRLYFGWAFLSAGLGKLRNIQSTAEYFESIHIQMPTLNAYMAGTTETVCGFLLMLGAGSRIITIPLIGTMLVAYLKAHTEQFYALFDSETRVLFFKAPPFPYLFTCFTVLLFGPGALSVDAYVKSALHCPNHGDRTVRAGDADGRALSPPPPLSIH